MGWGNAYKIVQEGIFLGRVEGAEMLVVTKFDCEAKKKVEEM